MKTIYWEGWTARRERILRGQIEQIEREMIWNNNKKKMNLKAKANAVKTILAATIFFMAVSAQASLVKLVCTNSAGSPDTNTLKVMAVSTIYADGTFTTIGTAQLWTPNASGIVTNYLRANNYFATNRNFKLYFSVPDNGSNVINAGDYQISGGNFFVTRLVSTNQVPAGVITNFQAGVTLTNAHLSGDLMLTNSGGGLIGEAGAVIISPGGNLYNNAGQVMQTFAGNRIWANGQTFANSTGGFFFYDGMTVTENAFTTNTPTTIDTATNTPSGRALNGLIGSATNVSVTFAGSATGSVSIVNNVLTGTIGSSNATSSANVVTNQSFLFPQTVVISNGVLGISTNIFDAAHFYWTNVIPPNKLFYSEVNTVWPYGTVLDPNDPSMDANPLYYIGFNGFPTNDSANWQDSNTVSLTVSAVVSSFRTNAIYNLSTTGIVYQIPDGSFIYGVDAFGRTLYQVVSESSYDVSFAPVYFYSETGPAYTVGGANNAGVAGVQSYMWNNASKGTIPYADKRFGVGLTTVFGTNGMYGALSEFLVLRRSNYVAVASPEWQFVDPIRIDGDGGISLGNNTYGEHAKDYKANATVKIRGSKDTNKPAFMIDGGYAYTGAPTNGAFWHTNNRIFLTQNSVTFPIPQINTTNATLSAATSFNWTFTSAFGNTNYSVNLTGAGVTLGTNVVIGAKTLTNVVVTFPSFTGIINGIAAQQ